MSTLKDLVVATRCRKGPAAGTTKRGAYWVVCGPIKLRGCGGDGIGNNGADVNFYLYLRHYRSGEVQATIERSSWHQNHGARSSWDSCPAILECATIEEVIVALKGHRFGNDGWNDSAYSDYHQDDLTAALAALGLPETVAAPDEVEA